MKALLLWPRMPDSFWSYRNTLQLAGLCSTNPPLGLLTVAALLPGDWQIRLVDRNVRAEREEDWAWCDLVILSAMIVQKEDLRALIEKGVALGKKVAVGGPFATSVPEFVLQAGAHYLILDEGECTIPAFLAALACGEAGGIFRATEKPDVTATPAPRFDLLDLNAYMALTVQFSRGCPFQCEFCDIINLFGRKPRTKTPEQMLAEFEAMYRLGWRRYVFVVDDNFIGNARNAKLFLRALIPWMEARHYPFLLLTEASVNLAEDPELLELMVRAGFTMVFLGIETPDVDSLTGVRKLQNTRRSLLDACETIVRAGLQVMSGFIIGFDHERPGAGERVRAFIEETGIPQCQFSLLQALQNTALWDRLEREGRLVEGLGTFHQGAIMNFVPTRPVAEIVEEYIDAFWAIYDPDAYLERTFRHFMAMGDWRGRRRFAFDPAAVRLFLALVWLQGVVRSTRDHFWRYLFTIARQRPQLLFEYLIALSAGEHFFAYRHTVRGQLREALGYPQPPARQPAGARPEP
jgi:radical SAM superfamily enzyme YgiQ (UPF0313 family)